MWLAALALVALTSLVGDPDNSAALARLEEMYTRDAGIKDGVQPVPSEKFGFYLHVFGRPAAVIHQVKRIKEVFPKSPMYLMSDGGVQFNGLCAKYNCTFKGCPPANDRWNPWPFLRRLWDAAVALKTECVSLAPAYIVMLEPDNTIHRPVYIEPPPHVDAGGINDANPRLPTTVVWKATTNGRKHRPGFSWNYTGTGLCGGSFFRTSAILDAFSDAAVAELDWPTYLALWSKNVFSSDFAMPVVLGNRGYTYSPWREMLQRELGSLDGRFSDQPREAAFEHYGRGVEGGKPTYNLKETSEDRALFEESPWKRNQGPFARCQGCYRLDEYLKAFNTSQCTNRLAEGAPPRPDGAAIRQAKAALASEAGDDPLFRSRAQQDEADNRRRFEHARAEEKRIYEDPPPCKPYSPGKRGCDLT